MAELGGNNARGPGRPGEEGHTSGALDAQCESVNGFQPSTETKKKEAESYDNLCTASDTAIFG